ncbi:hypothetical protein A3K70_03630 [Candidatus Bathyarchaeota archaeon RBG_16_48_13]|nr:MAG: hypothetical protein A3K70_03630 [Candidatus Bathyarchaeota archaeon RBG_16_48_13]
MKVVLVNPSITHGMRSAIDVEGAWPPLGLLYLATMLKEGGVPVEIFDNGPLGYSPEQLLKQIRSKKPDIVGFHTLSMSSLTANETSKLIKRDMPNIKVLYGGYHATVFHQKILREREYVDVVIRGEGEHTLIEVVDSIEKGKSLEGIRGVSFRDEGRIRVNPTRPPIEDLNSIPFPDPGFLDSEYVGTVNGMRTAVRKFTSMVTSRGCPLNCRFCCESVHELRTWRVRSPENVVEELSYLKSLGYGQMYLQDDSFTLDRKRVNEICRLIKREKLDILWAAMARVNNATADLMQRMREAGCQSVYFGIENANQRILDYYRKGITQEMAKDAVKNCINAKMDAFGGFILGAPTETEDEMWKTIRFAEEIGITFPSFYILQAYPGTAIWNENVANGYIKEDEYWETGVALPEVVPECIPMARIKTILGNGYRHVLTRPKFILEQASKLFMDPVRRQILLKNLNMRKIINLLNMLQRSEHYY